MSTITGTNNNDTLVSLAGADLLRGLLGSDTYLFSQGSGIDTVDESSGGGTDRLRFTDKLATSFLFSRSGTNLVIDTGFNDQVIVTGEFGSTAALRVESLVDSSGVTYTLSAGFVGTSGRNIVIGTSSAETISAGGGADIVFAGDGNDTVNGDGGNDTLNGGGGDDVLNGGSGTDTASYADSTAAVSVNLTSGLASGAAGTDTLISIENITGGSGDDVLAGKAGNNVLNGGAGKDTVSYADSAAAVTVSLAISGQQNTVGAGTDTLLSIENLIGSQFNDTLRGNGADNVLIGGVGNDTLAGDAGNDVYRYMATALNSSDVAAGQRDSLVVDAGDQIEFAGLGSSLSIGGTALLSLTSNTAVGGDFAQGATNIRFSSSHLQIDLNGDGQFVAGQDFDIAVSGASGLVYDAVADKFSMTMAVPTKKIALTFDDGPNWNETDTQAVLNVLSQKNVLATFFVVGEQVAAMPGPVQAEVAAGHMVEVHTWNHPDLTSLSDAQIHSQLQQTSDAIFNATGTRPEFYRPPYGSIDSRVDTIAQSLGLTAVMWTSDTNDWAMPGVNAIYNTAVSQAVNDGVILLHDGGGDRSQTIAALPLIIDTLRADGYEFVTIDKITVLPPLDL